MSLSGSITLSWPLSCGFAAGRRWSCCPAVLVDPIRPRPSGAVSSPSSGRRPGLRLCRRRDLVAAGSWPSVVGGCCGARRTRPGPLAGAGLSDEHPAGELGTCGEYPSRHRPSLVGPGAGSSPSQSQRRRQPRQAAVVLTGTALPGRFAGALVRQAGCCQAGDGGEVVAGCWWAR